MQRFIDMCSLVKTYSTHEYKNKCISNANEIKKTSIVTLFGERKSEKKQSIEHLIGNVKCISLNFIPELCSSLRHNVHIAQIVNILYMVYTDNYKEILSLLARTCKN